VFLLRGGNAHGRVCAEKTFVFEEAEVFPNGGKLPGAGLPAEALLAQVGEVLRNIGAADVVRRGDRAVGLMQEVSKLR
jgi:hypothetical protein